MKRTTMVAWLVAAFGAGGAVAQTGTPVPSAEVHATVPAVLVDGGRRGREGVLTRAGVAEDGTAVWIDGVQNYARSRFQSGQATARVNRTGVQGGVDFGTGDLRYGINGGYLDQRVRIAGRTSRAEIDTVSIGASLAYRPIASRLRAGGGVTHVWHDIDTNRGGFAANDDARSTEAFAEVGYLMPGLVTVSPFVRYAHDWTSADAVTETGGLRVGRDRRDAGFATLGARLGGAVPLGTTVTLQPKGTLSYERAFGDLRDGRSITGAAAGFTATGLRIGRDTFGVDLGGDLVFASGLRLGFGGVYSESKQWRDYGLRATAGLRF